MPRTSRTNVRKKTKNKKAVVQQPKPVVDTKVSDEPEPKVQRKRGTWTKERIVDESDQLVTYIESEIETLRQTPTKSKGIRFLRSIIKRQKLLKNHTLRALKTKKRTNRKNNTNSGFLKPVPISKQMAKFTGWDPTQLRSRVDVTKFICKYVRENDLQNPKDRRQILADKPLRKLLGYDPKTSEQPLTYYSLQTYMKKHFIKKEDSK